MRRFDADHEPIPPPIPPPYNVAAAPEDAHRTRSGLSYLVLQAGRGRQHPHPDARVEIHYTGWAANGAMFDSTVRRARPLTVRPRDLVRGLTEASTLMVEGESTRFWVPPELAYGDAEEGDTPRRDGAPTGMLVFDLELLRILP